MSRARQGDGLILRTQPKTSCLVRRGGLKVDEAPVRVRKDKLHPEELADLLAF